MEKEIKEANKEVAKLHKIFEALKIKDKLVVLDENATEEQIAAAIASNTNTLQKHKEAIEKYQEEVNAAKEKKKKAKAKEAAKAMAELEKAKTFLQEENIALPEKDSEVIALANKTKTMPKFPFTVRIHGQDIQEALGLENNKRYDVQAIKSVVTSQGAYFELADAEFKYDKKFNAIYAVMSSSKKG